MFTYSHASKPLGQSECAFYLSYFIINNNQTPAQDKETQKMYSSQVLTYFKIPYALHWNPFLTQDHSEKKKTVKTYLSARSFAFHITRFQLFTAFKTYENTQVIYYHASSIGEFFLRKLIKQFKPQGFICFS